MQVLRILLICLGSTASLAGAIEIQSIGPHAWAALQPTAQRFNDSNSLLVDAGDFFIVIDAQENADDVREIIAFARNAVGKPIRYVINTHWHSDHTQGNTIYREEYGAELIIIGHRSHLEDIPGRAAPYLQERVDSVRGALAESKEQLRSGLKDDGTPFTSEELAAQSARIERVESWVAANAEFQFTLPSVTVTTLMSVDAGVGSFVVIPLRGHTRGDLIVSFPQLGILATGDLVDEMPYSGHGYPAAWLAALPEIDALQADTLLPGHGKLLWDRKLLTSLEIYFTSLTTQVQDMVAEGKDLATVQADIDLSGSRQLLAGDDEPAGRFFDQVQAEAVQRSYEEASNNIK